MSGHISRDIRRLISRQGPGLYPDRGGFLHFQGLKLHKNTGCCERSELTRGNLSSGSLFVLFDLAIPEVNEPSGTLDNSFIMCAKQEGGTGLFAHL